MMHPEPSRVLPITMSALMVRALQDKCKRETRRMATSPLSRLRPGDLLWVREAIRIADINVVPTKLRYSYEADGLAMEIPWPKRLAKPLPGVRAPRFMPRELSRLTLRVIHIHHERLRDMSAADCYDEGIGATPHLDAAGGDPIRAFAALWDELHDKPGERWADNPEVAVIRFASIARGVDAMLPGLGHGGVR